MYVAERDCGSYCMFAKTKEGRSRGLKSNMDKMKVMIIGKRKAFLWKMAKWMLWQGHCSELSAVLGVW